MAEVLKVHSPLYYLTSYEGVKWRPEDYTNRNIVKGIKGEEFDGYFRLNVGGKNKRFDQENIDTLIPILMKSIGKKLDTLIKGNFTIVPIPNSSATVKSKAEFQTLRNAKLVAEAVGERASVSAAIKWSKEKNQDHKKKGFRDPRVHYPNLVLVEKLKGKVVLFDDVLNSGSQMVATCWRLRDQSIRPEIGITAASVTKEQMPKMMLWHTSDLEIEDSPQSLSSIF